MSRDRLLFSVTSADLLYTPLTSSRKIDTGEDAEMLTGGVIISASCILYVIKAPTQHLPTVFDKRCSPTSSTS